MKADTTRKRRYVTWREFEDIIRAFRQSIAEMSRIDVSALTARLDTIEHVTNHHVERIETYTPALIMQARKAAAQAEVLIARLESAIAEQEAWRQRDVQKTRAILDRDIWGRLRWLFLGE